MLLMYSSIVLVKMFSQFGFANNKVIITFTMPEFADIT